jgi:hypothetical protein
MNPVQNILGKKVDVSKDRTSDNSIPKNWGKYQQRIYDKIPTHDTEREGKPPWGLIKAKMRKKQAEEELQEENIRKINEQFKVDK